MRLDGQGSCHIAITEDNDRVASFLKQTNLGHRFGGYIPLPKIELYQAPKVNRFVGNLADIGKTTLERQTASQWQLATLEVLALTAATARALALGTTAGGFTLSGGDTTTYSLALFPSTWVWAQIV